MTRFQKGLDRYFLPVSLASSALIAPPFEPLALCSFIHLSEKGNHLSGLHLFQEGGRTECIGHSSTIHSSLYKDKVQMKPYHKFPSKVVSDFHLNQSIHLPVFFPKLHLPKQKLHTLDIRQALAFYLDKTKPFWVASGLSVFYTEHMRGHMITMQRLSKCIIICVAMFYTAKGVTAPDKFTVHLTKAHSTSFVACVPIMAICRAATWSSIHTFTRHYILSTALREDANVGKAVLQYLL